MVYTFNPQGVCSQEMTVEIDEQGLVQSLVSKGGCNGNLKGICSLLIGMDAEEAIRRMEGLRCGNKTTSCPDQIAQTLKEALAQ